MCPLAPENKGSNCLNLMYAQPNKIVSDNKQKKGIQFVAALPSYVS